MYTVLPYESRLRNTLISLSIANFNVGFKRYLWFNKYLLNHKYLLKPTLKLAILKDISVFRKRDSYGNTVYIALHADFTKIYLTSFNL